LVYDDNTSCLEDFAMDVARIRTQNLSRLVKQYGSQQALAKKLGVTVQRVNNLLSGYRNMGEKTARNFEEALSLPHLWMDMDDGQEIQIIPRVDGLKATPRGRYIDVDDDLLQIFAMVKSLSQQQRSTVKSVVTEMILNCEAVC
jgi:transcriptional regulator with XRE-family HTH domain